MFLLEFFVVAWIVWTLPFKKMWLTSLFCLVGAHVADMTPLTTLPLALIGQITWQQALENMSGQLAAYVLLYTILKKSFF